MANLPVSRLFGSLPTGEDVEAWTLLGAGGLLLEAITYGGIVRRLVLPDGTDVVLGFDSLAPYLAGHPFFGAIIGRVTGRLTGARFTLDGTTYSLPANDGDNTLHGGPVGFDKRLWNATPRVSADGTPSLRLHHVSPDGDQGFPGTLDVTIDYSVTADNTFVIESAVTTTKPTPVSLAHHSYFNLSGHASGDVLDHMLQVNSTHVVPTVDDLTLLDRREPVNTATDLRTPQRLREAVTRFPSEHGALYPTGAHATPIDIASLTHPAYGRQLDCATNAPYVQVYTASHLIEPDAAPIAGKAGATYGKFAGLCLECEGYANAANAPHMDSRGILRPGETQRFITAYRFSSPKGGL